MSGAVLGLYDRPMWDSIRARRMALQRCEECGAWQYPPGPACPRCGSSRLAWTALSGEGRIVSWAVFHRQYLPDYPAPYNVVAVGLQEGPMLIGNLEPPEPDGSWIGRRVRLVYASRPGDIVLPRWTIAPESRAA